MQVFLLEKFLNSLIEKHAYPETKKQQLIQQAQTIEGAIEVAHELANHLDTKEWQMDYLVDNKGEIYRIKLMTKDIEVILWNTDDESSKIYIQICQEIYKLNQLKNAAITNFQQNRIYLRALEQQDWNAVRTFAIRHDMKARQPKHYPSIDNSNIEDIMKNAQQYHLEILNTQKSHQQIIPRLQAMVNEYEQIRTNSIITGKVSYSMETKQRIEELKAELRQLQEQHTEATDLIKSTKER